jgi:rRNA maturation protein Nop10
MRVLHFREAVYEAGTHAGRKGSSSPTRWTRLRISLSLAVLASSGCHDRAWKGATDGGSVLPVDASQDAPPGDLAMDLGATTWHLTRTPDWPQIPAPIHAGSTRPRCLRLRSICPSTSARTPSSAPAWPSVRDRHCRYRGDASRSTSRSLAPCPAKRQRVIADGIGFIQLGGGSVKGRGTANPAESPALAVRGRREGAAAAAAIILSLAG